MCLLSADQSCAPMSMRTSWLRSCRLPAHCLYIDKGLHIVFTLIRQPTGQLPPIRLSVEAS